VLWRGAIVARTIPDTAPVTEVGVDWLAPNGDAHTAHTRVTFARPSDVASPRRLAMSVGLLVRDAGFSVVRTGVGVEVGS
jgi:type VI protein secretion system component Hcp